MQSRTLLLDLPVPMLRRNGELFVEEQALNGLRQWRRNFDGVTVTAPTLESSAPLGSSVVYVPAQPWLAQEGCRLIPLPSAWSPLAHFRHVKEVRHIFEREIAAHRFLCFCNLGGFGAWGSVASEIAAAQNRPYAVWLDIVNEISGDWWTLSRKALAQRVYTTIHAHRTEQSIRQASLGLFHGKSVFDTYAHLPRKAEVVHNIHLKPSDAISAEALQSKVAHLKAKQQFHIGYAGRAHPDKGPMEWLAAAHALCQALPDAISFSWLGDGPMLDTMRQYVQAHGLADKIALKGFIKDRTELLNWYRSLDLFMFCHLTRESPRNLIESLISGTPIIGFHSSYAEDLLAHAPSGQLVPLGDSQALGDAVKHVLLAPDKALAAWTEAAAVAGTLFSDEQVFAHRSELIQQSL